MSFKTEHRGFAVGREVGRCGRCTRFVLGLLGLIYIAAQFSQARLSGALIGQIAGGALLSTTLYIVLFWALGEKMFAHIHPFPATLHGLLPAQCHRPGRAPIHAMVNRSEYHGSQCSIRCRPVATARFRPALREGQTSTPARLIHLCLCAA